MCQSASIRNPSAQAESLSAQTINDIESDNERVCWICLAEDDVSGHLVRPCNCPRWAHPKCLARWQLHSAGRDEEHVCRFCNQILPDWRPILTPANVHLTVPVVSVHYNGMCYKLRVAPGETGLQAFKRSLQKITGVPALENMQITFQCRSPDSAQELSFRGINAFDAAIHCAAVSAAERKQHHHHGSHCSATSNSQSNDSRSNHQPCESSASSPRTASPAPSHSDDASTSSASSASNEMQVDDAYLHGRQDEVHGRLQGSPISSMQRLWEGAPAGMSSDEDTSSHDQDQHTSRQASLSTMSDRQGSNQHRNNPVGQRFRTLLRRLFE